MWQSNDYYERFVSVFLGSTSIGDFVERVHTRIVMKEVSVVLANRNSSGASWLPYYWITGWKLPSWLNTTANIYRTYSITLSCYKPCLAQGLIGIYMFINNRVIQFKTKCECRGNCKISKNDSTEHFTKTTKREISFNIWFWQRLALIGHKLGSRILVQDLILLTEFIVCWC